MCSAANSPAKVFCQHQHLFADLQRVWQSPLFCGVALKPHHQRADTCKQTYHRPNETQQSHTFVALLRAPGWWASWAMSASQSFPLSFYSLTLRSNPVVRHPSRHSHGCPPTCQPNATPFQHVIDRSNYVFLLACRSQGAKALHCLSSKGGEMATVLLVEKMTDILADVNNWCEGTQSRACLHMHLKAPIKGCKHSRLLQWLQRPSPMMKKGVSQIYINVPLHRGSGNLLVW